MKSIFSHYTTTYPLARRMVWIVSLCGILLTFAAAALQMYAGYRRELDQLNARLQQIQIVAVPILVNSIWHFDNQQIETQLLGMLNLQDISYVQLRVMGGETYTFGKSVPADAAIAQTIDLVYTQNNETFPLGQLDVIADRRDLQQRVSGWLARYLLSAAIQIFVLAGLILFVVERLLTRPLNEIVRYAETLDLEHLEKPLTLTPRPLAPPGDELQLVALKLNEMRRRLMEDVAEREQMEAALRQSERNYREIFNATSEAIFIHDIPDGNLLQVNGPMLRLYGYAHEAEVLGRNVSELGDNRPPYTEVEAKGYLQKAITEGPQIFEWLARKKTGETFWAEVSLRCSIIGGEQRVLAVVRDITGRKQTEALLMAQNEALIAQQHALERAEAQTRQLNIELEQRVKERTLQLTALNQELEAFGYSVAHDLRAPLRHMNGFSQMLLEEHGAELSAEAKKLLQRIHDAASDLSGMVDALLSLSRLTRDEMRPTQVNLSALAQEIAANLSQREPGRQVTLDIAPDLTVQADKHLVQIVLENLLGNAWKFSAQRQPAQIQFGCLPATPEDGIVYFVRDNGVGFDMAYASRLFSPFQRLHSAETFSGTGIGLATVKRIIQRHGGRIWTESAVERGATFYFTLPASAAAPNFAPTI